MRSIKHTKAIFVSILLSALFITHLSTSTISVAKYTETKEPTISIDDIIVDTESIDSDKSGKAPNKEKEDSGKLEPKENIKPEKEENTKSAPKAVNRKSSNVSTDKEYNLALKYLAEGKKFEARKILSQIFLTNREDKNSVKIKEQLDSINKSLVFSPEPSPDAFFYTVKGGDTLGKIAKKCKTTYELIMLINRKYRTNIRVGERLKIINGTFDVFVDKSDFKLILTLNNHYIKQYDIGTGKNDKTPVGEFEVAEKMIEPTWYSGEGVYPYGHEKNVLGTRWIGFKDKPGYYGFGIHGTANPESIGKSESNGCVRLRNKDVEEIYVFVTDKTKIVIQN